MRAFRYDSFAMRTRNSPTENEYSRLYTYQPVESRHERIVLVHLPAPLILRLISEEHA